jgi:hypothetical protein
MVSESTVKLEPVAAAQESCAHCGAPLASDQHYCLNCGSRKAYLSSQLSMGTPASPAGTPPSPPSGLTASAPAPSRPNPTALIAGVGVLLLAMGVGVLIGRSSVPAGKTATNVINLATTATGQSASTESQAPGATFKSDWPSGSAGYTVQLETLAESSTQASAVSAAKTAASGKGAPAVGALASSEYSSLPSGNYVIYSGVDKTKAQAEKALTGLKSKFPKASVVNVSSGAGSAAGGSGSPGSGAKGSGSSKPPPASSSPSSPSQKPKSGAEYEQKSKNLPNVVETG